MKLGYTITVSGEKVAVECERDSIEEINADVRKGRGLKARSMEEVVRFALQKDDYATNGLPTTESGKDRAAKKLEGGTSVEAKETVSI